jgi:hypothetical protein
MGGEGEEWKSGALREQGSRAVPVPVLVLAKSLPNGPRCQ